MSAKTFLAIAFALATFVNAGGAPFCCASVPELTSQVAAGQSPATRKIGAVKSINGSTITIAPDTGADVIVTVQATTRMVRVAPGEKNLKNATPVQLQDIQVGDRILVGGAAAADGQLSASSIVVMKRSDVEASHQQDLQDWQKRGVGGLVSAVDAGTGAVTISVTGFGGSKNISIHTTKGTIIRRYAPDSVKFDDAKTGTLADIHNGDQLRARGERSADGTELDAVEIVSGSFRNIAGTVSAVDPAASSITIQDLLSKKTLQVKVTAESQLRQLPAEMAQHMAMRLKAGAAGAAGAANSAAGSSENQGTGQTARPAGVPSGAGPAGRGMGGGHGTPDFQQLLSHVPALALADLHKGDAVLIVSTEGSASTGGTVITLVSGVDPILRAAPNAGQAMMLAPWSLGAPADAGSQ